MHYQKLSILALAATAFAAPQDNSDAIMSDLSSLKDDVGNAIPTDINIPDITAFMPPPSILSALETAIPTDVAQSIMSKPQAWASEFASSIENGKTPDWYKGLPQSVKDYFSSQSAHITSAFGTDVPSVTGGSSGGNSPATPTATPNGSSSSGGAATDSASASPSGSGSPTQSDNIAPRATGAVVASLAGVAGILGLALGL